MNDATATPGGTAPETAGRTIRSWARFYDLAAWLMSFGRAPAIRRMTLDLAELAPGEKVLDVGCGTGTLAIMARERVGATGDVHGIDASPEMIGVAARKAGKAGVAVDFRVAPMEDLPYGAGRFDVVLSSLMLHHLPDEVKRQGLAEVRRVLKPGGRWLAVDLAGDASHSLVGHLITLLGRHRVAARAMDDMTGMLEELGFVDVEAGPTKYKGLWWLRGRTPQG